MQTATQGRRSARTEQPETLIQAAMRRANEVHAVRMAEIKAMEKQLALFEGLMPAIRAAGIVVHSDEISFWNFGKKCLRICAPILREQRNVTLERVLRDLGMREDGRNTYRNGDYSLDLVKGHLRVSMTVPACALPKPTEAAQ